MDTRTSRGFLQGRFSRSELTGVTVAAIVAVSIAFLIMPPSVPNVEMVDHTLYTYTVDEMRSGAGYYLAADSAFSAVYGQERVDVTESWFAFRPPTVFLVWQLLPGDQWIWYLFVLASAIAGITATRLVSFPPTAILPSVYLLSVGMLNQGGVWTAQYTTTELWAVPAMFGAIAAVKTERWPLAATLGFLAVLIRETAVPFLIVGLIVSVFKRLPWAPWLLATGTVLVLYSIHVAMALEYVDPGAGGTLTSRADIPGSMLRILGFGLPAGTIAGVTLWVLTWVYVFRRFHQPWLASAYLWLPLVGLLVERHYWGILVVPFTLMWGLEEAGFRVRQVLQGVFRPRAARA